VRGGDPDRAHATLSGLAIGDALGMPTQSLSRQEIVEQFETILTHSTLLVPIIPSRQD